ncbi:alpha/beta fold hydrolase [Flindersiella endophytica]
MANVKVVFTERGTTDHIAWARTRPDVDVLLLHGFSDSGDCWAPLLPALGPTYGFLATDARGHGRSGLPEEPTGSETSAGDAARVLRTVPGFRSGGAIVMGHSMGAATASMLAARHPELVRALILEDPPNFPRGGRRPTSSSGGMPDWLVDVRARGLDERIAACRESEPDWPADELEPWAVSKDQFNPHLLELPSAEPTPLPEVLADVGCPILFVYGDPERGSINSHESVRTCAEATKADLRPAYIEGAGHSVRRDRRLPYAAAVLSFLAEQLS